MNARDFADSRDEVVETCHLEQIVDNYVEGEWRQIERLIATGQRVKARQILWRLSIDLHSIRERIVEFDCRVSSAPEGCLDD